MKGKSILTVAGFLPVLAALLLARIAGAAVVKSCSGAVRDGGAVRTGLGDDEARAPDIDGLRNEDYSGGETGERG